MNITIPLQIIWVERWVKTARHDRLVKLTAFFTYNHKSKNWKVKVK